MLAIGSELPIFKCQLIKFTVISEEEALEKILEAVRPLPARKLSISNSLGCFAAEDYFARLPLPAFDNSAMDGYAVRAADVASATPESPARLRLAGKVERHVNAQSAGLGHGVDQA